MYCRSAKLETLHPKTHASNGARKQVHMIKELNEDSYKQLVQGDQSLIALILMVNTLEETSAKLMVDKFLRITGCYKNNRLRIYYLCYATNKNWLKNLLNQCQGLTQEDIDRRELHCLSGNVATAVALLNSKKQVCLFPETVEENSSITPGRTGLGNDKKPNDHVIDRKRTHWMEAFNNWMEKFADGILKRYHVTTWPEWS